MEYSKYSDVSALLIELCTPFSDSELNTWAKIASKMSNDPKFNASYTAEIKNLYLAKLPEINKGTYKPSDFTTINDSICQKIETNQPIPAVLLPEYSSLSNTVKKKYNIKQRTQAVIAKLNAKASIK